MSQETMEHDFGHSHHTHECKNCDHDHGHGMSPSMDPEQIVDPSERTLSKLERAMELFQFSLAISIFITAFIFQFFVRPLLRL